MKWLVAKLSRLRIVVVVLLGATLLTGCVPEDSVVEPLAESSPVQDVVEEETEPIFLIEVIDGDTLMTSVGKVRIIGIDAPEAGECGYAEAITAINQVVSVSEPITLELPDGQNDTDHYDRLLRYVITESEVDLGLMLIEAGLAVARYDSTDGYHHHPNQSSYHKAQTAMLDGDGLACE